MPDVHTHEIVLSGRLGSHLLGPFLDDFTIEVDTVGSAATGCTRLVGTVRDSSHLHGLVAYLASINAELISITPIHTSPNHTNTRSTS